MAEPRNRKKETPRDLYQKKLFWRTAGLMASALAVLTATTYLAVRLHEETPGNVDHLHERAAHGGLIVSLGGDSHWHAEVVLGKCGSLRLYMLGEDVTRVVEVESQIVKALVRPEGASAATEVELMPIHQPGDTQGKTAQFAATIPMEFRKKRLTITAPQIAIDGMQLAFEFRTPGFTQDGDEQTNDLDLENLYKASAGKYTEADIRMNGKETAPMKFKGFKARHDASPRPGDRVCPVSRTKANPECQWIVNGKTYEFCCPPCIDEFIRRAKEQPQAIEEPEQYVKK